MENRQKFLDDYCSSETKEIEPKYGIEDRGLTARLAERQPDSWYSRIVKCAKRAVMSAVLAAGVLLPAYCTEAALPDQQAALQKKPVQSAEKRTGSFLEYVKGAYDNRYDNHNNFHKDSLEDLLSTSHKIYGQLTVEITKYNYSKDKVTKSVSQRTMTGIGTGFVVANDGRQLTLVTCNHVVKLPELEDELDEEDRPVTTYKVKEVKYMLEQQEVFAPIISLPLLGVRRISTGPELAVIARDEEHDVAIIKTKPEYADSIKNYKTVSALGNSEELEEGDFLYIVGFPENITKQVMSGYVSSKGNPYTSLDDHLFFADATINKGNSGGPVYALRDGKPEVVGITSRLYPEGMGGIVRIEYAKRLLEKIASASKQGGKK